MADELTANEELLDRIIRHAHYIERFKASEIPRLLAVLDELDDDLLAQLAKYDPDSLSAKRLKAMIDKIQEISDEASAKYQAALDGTLEEYGNYEARWSAAAIGASMGAEFVVLAGLEIVTPSENLVHAAIFSRPLQGRLLKDWVADLAKARRDRLAAAIRIAAIEQQTTQQLIRRIRGTRAQDFKDGILEISRHGATALARTALQHVTNSARNATIEQNADVVDMVQWVSTLDGRTTPYCRAMDGKRFPIGKGPRPPAHINCRSTTVPVLKSWEELGIEADEIGEGTRASMDGQVPDSLDYDEWLRRQEEEFQDDVLGPTKAELFRSGLKIDRFVDLKSQRPFTIAELREREREIWKIAFGP